MDWIKFEDKPPTITLQATKILCHCPKWITPIVAYYTHFEGDEIQLKDRLSVPTEYLKKELEGWRFFRLPTHYAIIDKPKLPPNATIEQKIGELTDKYLKQNNE